MFNIFQHLKAIYFKALIAFFQIKNINEQIEILAKYGIWIDADLVTDKINDIIDELTIEAILNM